MHEIAQIALSQFPVIGQQLQQPTRLGGGTAGLLIGGLGALYGGLGVALAVQSTMNTIWAVPRNNRPNPIKAAMFQPSLPGIVPRLLSCPAQCG